MEEKKARSSARGKFTRATNSLNRAINESALTVTIENRYEELKQAWKEVREKHDEYVNKLTDYGEDEESWISELSQLFDESEIKTDNYLEGICRKEREQMEQKALAEFEKKEKMVEAVQTKRIKELLVKRDQEGMKFYKYIDTTKRLLETESDTGREHVAMAINDALTRLHEVVTRCDKAQEEYITALTSSNGDLITSQGSWIEKIAEEYNEICNEGKIFISLHEKKGVIPAVTAKSGIILEKLKFEPFTGELRKYPRFKEEFLKHIKPMYKPYEEAFVLKSYLAAEIKEDVDNLGDDANEIWKRLDQKYNDTSKLVDSIMSEIKQLDIRANVDATETLHMIKVVERAHRDLKSLGLEKEISNSTIVSMIEEKLPEEIEKEWIKIVTGENRSELSKNKFPALLELLLQFKERIEYKSSSLRTKPVVKGGVNAINENARRDENSNDSDRKPLWCWLHPNSTDHPIWRCKVFTNKSAAEKVNLVRQNRACFSCLAQGHTSRFCKRNFKCTEEGCGMSHHWLLHEAHASGISFHGTRKSNLRDNPDTNILLQLQRVKAGRRGGNVSWLNVLWDGGSTLSFITFEQARKMQLVGEKVRLEIIKIGGVVEEIESFRYNLVFVDNAGVTVPLTVLGIKCISSDIKAININGVIKMFKNTNEKDFDRPNKGQIDCLIGYEYAAFHPVRTQANGHLLLLENRFGKVIGGAHPQLVEKTRKVVKHVTVHHANTANICMEDFYSMEQLGVQCTPRCGSCKCGQCHPGGKEMTLKEEREYKLIEDRLVYKPNANKWEAGYPWIKDPKTLPDNRPFVLGALKATERRLKKFPEHAKVYQRQIEDMVKRGAARKLTKIDMDDYNGPTFYISHHEVLKPESKSTPCRIVFNSSANFRGHILNEYYAKGPDMLNNLLGVLVRFREKPVAMIGDIGKMFHAIDIPLIDQMTHRFLWRDLDEEKEPETYVMTSVNMGDRPSATIAMIALRKTAEMSKSEFPQACETIISNSYMDDIPDSVNTIEEARKLTKEIDQVLEKGGFKTKEWVYSGREREGATHMGRDEQRAIQLLTSVSATTNGTGTERVLGMGWDPGSDKLVYQVKLNFSTKKRKVHSEPNLSREQIPGSIPLPLTKRQVLSQVNGIYDPMGLISPFTVRAKIMLRKLWSLEKKLDWDDPIPQCCTQEWMNFFEELFQLEESAIQRCIQPATSIGQPLLVLFSDGSTEAYGAAAYARWLLADGTFAARLIASKNRIAPMKIIDIVRLELAGAVLSKRLRVFIQKELRYKFSAVCHIIDSEIVKAMISKESYGFNTYAANRIGEIQQDTDPSEWVWMAGSLNIADWVTRGKSPKELGEESEWQNGPEFLKLPVNEWPVSHKTNVQELPERHKRVILAVDAKEIDTLANRVDISRFSKIELLLNTTARILNLYKRYKKRSDLLKDDHAKVSELTVSDREAAETFWIRDAQSLIEKDVKDGKFVKLCPRRKNDVIVVGGRAERWMQATWNKQEFILLPYDHRLSRLIAENEHVKSGHLGAASTVARIRSRFWIINIQKMVKSICNKCVKCQKKFRRLCGQIMKSLPLERLQPSPPFANVGVDFFGPFTIKGEVQKRTRGRCYGVVFTCFTSRAVYVDISSDYSTDTFLQVMRRFASVRGWPRKVYSDNGTQLVAASKELKNVVKGLDETTLKRFGVEHGTEWSFTPADAPWMNGATEALVKSVKRALNAAIGDQVMRFSELQTAMFEAAQIVNQRPIGRHPTNPQDGAYLCPNDLLLGRASPNIPQGPFQERVSHQFRFDYIQQVVESFWKKWTRDFFPGMIVRQKWHVDRRNVKVGDIVIIQDSNVVRGEWRMGVVTAVHPSDDTKVRRVTVSYKNYPKSESINKYSGTKYTSIERAVQRLIVLVAVDENTEHIDRNEKDNE